jgi:hypothetical protein
MTKEEVGYEILKKFASKVNFEFESYGDLWSKYHKTLHCTREIFNELLDEFQSAGYIDISVNGHFTPSQKSKTAYINHHVGRERAKEQKERENQKFNHELKALKFSNSKVYRILTLGGMILGIVGGGFGIASYYNKDSTAITNDQLKIYVDSVNRVNNSTYINRQQFQSYIDSITINEKESNTSDCIFKNSN